LQYKRYLFWERQVALFGEKFVDKQNLPQYKYFNNLIVRKNEMDKLVGNYLSSLMVLTYWWRFPFFKELDQSQNSGKARGIRRIFGEREKLKV